jgi:hypothetical protein
MANTDYSLSGGGNFTTVATLTEDLGPGDTTVLFSTLRGAQPVVGDALMIGNEIMRLDALNGGSMTVGRGCADTIPKTHEAGLPIWFLNQSRIGGNKVAYAAAEEIGVKPLPRTSNKPNIAIASAPARGLTFLQRFARPYPPGRMRINDVAFYANDRFTVASEIAPTLALTWRHRDRITQADQLVSHEEANVGPEAGVTYRLRVYKDDVAAPIAEHADITADNFDYTIDQAATDFGLTNDSPDFMLSYAASGIENNTGVGAKFAAVAGGFIYTASQFGVAKLNETTLVQSASRAFPPSITGLAAAGGFIYVVDSGNADTGTLGRVSKLDATDLTDIVAPVELPEVADGNAMVYADGDVWVAQLYSHSLTRYSGATLAAGLSLDIGATQLATDGTYVYALTEGLEIQRIEAATTTVVDIFPVAGNGLICVLGDTLYLSGATGVIAYDKYSGHSSGVVIAESGTAIMAFGDRLALLIGNQVRLYDTATHELIASFIFDFAWDDAFGSPELSMLSESRFLVNNLATTEFYDELPPEELSVPEKIEYGTLTLHAVRDGLESITGYAIPIQVRYGYQEPVGIGRNLGRHLGGVIV